MLRTTLIIFFTFMTLVCISNAGRINIIYKDGRFIAYSNGVVEDAKTGLEWIAGPDRNTTWHEARRWVAGLRVDGGGWSPPLTALG